MSRNDKEAVRWYQKAAVQDHPGAQFTLGAMYAAGRGVTVSDLDAVQWYRKAAERNHAEAQYNLAVRYLSGRGVSASPEEAFVWFRTVSYTHLDVYKRQVLHRAAGGFQLVVEDEIGLRADLAAGAQQER